MQLWTDILGVTAIAYVADDVSPLNARPIGEPGRIGVLGSAQPVVGAGSVVVEVNVEIVVTVVAAKQEKVLVFTQFREVTAPLASFTTPAP